MRSNELMSGSRFKLFCLSLRFIGWGILCICTMGLGFLLLIPYMVISQARFYDDLMGASYDVGVSPETGGAAYMDNPYSI